MRHSVLLVISIALSGCAAMLPDTPRITTGLERPTLAEITAGTKPMPYSVAIYLSKDALEPHAIEHSRDLPGISHKVFDYGRLEPFVASAVKNNAAKAFDRVFYSPQFPNTALWREGIDFVVVVESARANYAFAKDLPTSMPHGRFAGWEVVLVTNVYTIDGRPFGFYDQPKNTESWLYRTEVVVPPPPDMAKYEAEWKGVEQVCRAGIVQCIQANVEIQKRDLAYAVDVAIGQAFRRIGSAPVAEYLERHISNVDVGFSEYLRNKDDSAYLEQLRRESSSAVGNLTPATAAPTIDKVQWIVDQQRTSAQLSALSGAVSSFQAQNYARMGQQTMANNSAMLAQMQNQSAQATFRDLERAGFSGMDDTTKGLLTLIGGVASYQQYRAQKAAATASRADPRSCQELLRMRNQAVQNRNAMRSVSAQPGLTSSGRPTGQAGAQQDAANAYQTIYNSYCQ